MNTPALPHPSEPKDGMDGGMVRHCLDFGGQSSMTLLVLTGLVLLLLGPPPFSSPLVMCVLAWTVVQYWWLSDGGVYVDEDDH